MSYKFFARFTGKYACFTRPEFKAERRSYDCLTPSAAKGLLEAVHWKPEMQYRIHRIFVEKPIRFVNLMRNEITSDRNVQPLQRMSTILYDVSYVIDAEVVAGNEETRAKHFGQVTRYLEQGRCYRQPYFGCREYMTETFGLVRNEDEITPIMKTADLGLMFKDRRFKGKNEIEELVFFNAEMKQGVLHV